MMEEETKFECPHVKSGEETTGFVIDLGDMMKLYLCSACKDGFLHDANQKITEAVTDVIDSALREAIDN